jgi:hypothetical protein
MQMCSTLWAADALQFTLKDNHLLPLLQLLASQSEGPKQEAIYASLGVSDYPSQK